MVEVKYSIYYFQGGTLEQKIGFSVVERDVNEVDDVACSCIDVSESGFARIPNIPH